MSTNVVTTLWKCWDFNQNTTLVQCTQCCLDIHTTLLGCLKVSTFERCYNVETDIETTLAPMLWQHCRNVGVLARISLLFPVWESLEVSVKGLLLLWFTTIQHTHRGWALGEITKPTPWFQVQSIVFILIDITYNMNVIQLYQRAIKCLLNTRGRHHWHWFVLSN